MIKEEIYSAMAVMQDCINKFDKRITDKKKGLAAAIELGVTDGKELQAEIKADENKVKAFKTAYSALNRELESITVDEHFIEKRLPTVPEPSLTVSNTYTCLHCGAIYSHKPSICYNGCKRRLWEDDSKRSDNG